MLTHLFCCALLGLPLAFSDPETTEDGADATAALVEELRALRFEVAALTTQVSALQQEMKRQKSGSLGASTSSRAFPGPSFDPVGPDVEQLQQVSLRPGARPDEVRAYVSAIMQASKNQNSYSDRDPQIDMLMAVGSAGVPILLEFLGGDRFGSRDFYVKAAVNRLAGDEHKAIILEKLASNQELVEIVVRSHWIEDAHPVLLAALERKPQYLPREWIDAVVQLNDPTTYASLIAFFVDGSNRSQTFEALQQVKNLPLDDAVAKAWDRARYDQRWERDSMAAIAIGYGHLDALEHVATQVRAGTSDEHQLQRMVREMVSHVAQRGTVQEVADWVLDNKNRLQWDAASEEFRLP